MNKKMRLDFTELQEISRGDTNFIVKIIDIVLGQLNELILTMPVLLEKKDWNGVYSMVHIIKPSLHYIGVKELKNEIKAIEEFLLEKKQRENIADIIFDVIISSKEVIKMLKIEKEKY